MLELLSDPSIWVGLVTLVVLEIVLGIDNLIFIAILAEKLPPHQRDRARVVGLSLALIMRLALLSAISWLVTLTTPLFEVFGLGFSGRELILLLGGLFLLFKATTELHERIEGVEHTESSSDAYASFSLVVAQIVVLDAVFSLDAVITAVGMVNHLPVMMAAVVISIGLMLLASKPLTRFVNAHPTVVILCLSFLLMIGLSLVAEGLGFHLPKGYLYAAIGFSILIEFFNQWSLSNQARHQARRPLRERTAESVLRLLGGSSVRDRRQDSDAGQEQEPPAFAAQERNMVSGVLSLAERNVRSIMTPRSDISWVDLESDPVSIRAQLLETPHNMFPVGRGSLDEVVGIARAKDLLGALDRHGAISRERDLRPVMYVPESSSVIKLVDTLRQAREHLVLVSDEYGMLQGMVTPLDVLEAIAGEFPDEDEALEVEEIAAGQWSVAGTADLHQLELMLGVDDLVSEDGNYNSLAGFLLERFGQLPAKGDSLEHGGLRFRVMDMDEHRIKSVRVEQIQECP
ncbi:TerC family protein [Comamonas composti]|uniref:TerC family protein n=1 Tax=Comamonas composti TaxID=408558 RepID=UPI00042550CC|nr:TerC family protein [Comamonas composti]